MRRILIFFLKKINNKAKAQGLFRAEADDTSIFMGMNDKKKEITVAQVGSLAGEIELEPTGLARSSSMTNKINPPGYISYGSCF